MKKRLFYLSLLIILVTSCSNGGTSSSSQFPESDKYFSQGQTGLYTIVSSEEETNYAYYFKSKLMETANINCPVRYDTESTIKNEIIIGNTEKNIIDNIYLYKGFSITFKSGKIYLYGSDYDELCAGYTYFCNNLDHFMKKDAYGYIFPEDTEFVSSSVDSLRAVPKYSKAKSYTLFDTGVDGYGAYYGNTKLDDYKTYKNELLANGYQQEVENTINGNCFLTLFDAEKKYTISLNYIQCESKLMCFIDPFINLNYRGDNNDTSLNIQPLLTQVSVIHGYNKDGMSYLYRLKDGRFIVIDGGWAEGGKVQSKHLYDLIVEQNKLEKPTIACWILTHIHEDHIGAFIEFAKEYSDKVTIQSFCDDLGSKKSIADGLDSSYAIKNNDSSNMTNYYDVVENYLDKATHIRAHAGLKFYLGGAEIEFLLTYNDQFPNTYTNLETNAASSIFTVTLEDQRVLYLADCMPTEGQLLMDMYDDYLSCNFMQMAHHGYNGATIELYQLINPIVAFWPSNPESIAGNSQYGYNKFLISPTNTRCRELLVAGYYEFTLKLPYVATNMDFDHKFINKPN